MTSARPLRFLALVLGLWIGARLTMLAIPGGPQPASPARTIARVIHAVPSARRVGRASIARRLTRALSYQPASLRRGVRTASIRASRLYASTPPEPAPARSRVRSAPPLRMVGSSRPPAAPAGMLAPPNSGPSRWSGSAWLLVRDGRGQAPLAPGGTLGGSQAGARLLYRAGGGVSLSGRFYLPLRRTAGAEVAAGIDWRPFARVPVHLLAERRQDVGGAGRSAFALTLYGGANGRLPGGLRGEAYAQAGVVGTRSRDLFVDASARAGAPVGPIEIGGAAWGAAQPGAARLDAGPFMAYRLPVRDANIRVQADWRFRIAGDAAPGSGPALSIGVDF